MGLPKVSQESHRSSVPRRSTARFHREVVDVEGKPVGGLQAAQHAQGDAAAAAAVGGQRYGELAPHVGGGHGQRVDGGEVVADEVGGVADAHLHGGAAVGGAEREVEGQRGRVGVEAWTDGEAKVAAGAVVAAVEHEGAAAREGGRAHHLRLMVGRLVEVGLPGPAGRQHVDPDAAVVESLDKGDGGGAVLRFGAQADEQQEGDKEGAEGAGGKGTLHDGCWVLTFCFVSWASVRRTEACWWVYGVRGTGVKVCYMFDFKLSTCLCVSFCGVSFSLQR